MSEGIKISQLQEKSDINGSEYLLAQDGGTNKKISTSKFATKEEIPSLDNYITTEVADEKYQTKGDYITEIPSDVVRLSENKNIILPVDGSVTMIQEVESGSGGVVLCQRNYGEGNVTELGNSRNKLTLNATERPQVDLSGGKKENLAFSSDLETLATKKELENKVDKDGEKVLSTNDFTNEYKEKLDSINSEELLTKSEASSTYQVKGDYVLSSSLSELVSKDELSESIKLIPIEVNIPIRTLKDQIYSKEDILGWFGVAEETELKDLISNKGPMYVKYGISLSTNPHYYKMPVDYCAFETDNQVKLVFNGLDTTDDTPSRYTIILNLDESIVSSSSNVGCTVEKLAMNKELEKKLNVDTYNSDKATFATKEEIPSLDDYVTTEVADGKYQTKGDYITSESISSLPEIEEVKTKISGEGVSAIKVVTEIPGEPEPDVLYIVIPKE